MASSVQSILKIEDLTSEEDACKPNQDVLYEECLIDDDEDEDDDDDEPMLTTNNTSTKDTPSTSSSFRQDDSQNKPSSEDTQSSENRDSKSYVKTNPYQFEAMATFMLSHPDFSNGVVKNLESRTKFNEMWNKLSDILNKKGPPGRSREGWKKVWCDHKAYIRNKIRKNKMYYLEPRGGINKFYPLTRIETSVANCLGYISNEAGGDVTSTLSTVNGITAEAQAPSTVNSSTVDEPTHNTADQSDDLIIENDCEEFTLPSDRYSPPLSRKRKKELLQTQIQMQREYTKHSKKMLIEINDNLKGLLKYSIKSYELDEKRFELEKEKFIFKQKVEERKHQTDMEKLQLQRDILRLKQETAGFT